ncbi:MAG: hypothetical protein ACPGUV_03565 [Polyangiales bacterium]
MSHAATLAPPTGAPLTGQRRFGTVFPVALTLSAALAAASCARRDAAPPLTAGADFRTHGDAEVELLARGVEPRRALRYRLQPGQREQVDLRLSVLVDDKVGSERLQSSSVPLRLRLALGPVAEARGQRYRYPLHVLQAQWQDDAEGIEATRAQLSAFVDDSETGAGAGGRDKKSPAARTATKGKASTRGARSVRGSASFAVESRQWQHQQSLTRDLERLRSLRGFVEIDTRGRTHALSLQLPQTPRPSTRLRAVLASLRAALRHVPLPEEAVGSGARWRVRRSMDVKGLHLQQTLVYTLDQLMGPGGRVRVALRQWAEPQALPGTTSGLRAELQHYETAGEGTAHYNLHKLAPVSATDVHARIRALVHHSTRERTVVRSDLRTLVRIDR